MLTARNSNDRAYKFRDGVPDALPRVEAPYELEADPQGRFRCWGILMATPGLFYHGAWVAVNSEDLHLLKAHQERLLGLGYEIPVLVCHDEQAQEGRRSGEVGVFEIVRGVDGEDYLLGALTFSDAQAEARKASGEYRYLSAGIGPYQDDLGHEAPWGVYEVSIVPRPWQKRLGPTHLLQEDHVSTKTRIKTGEPGAPAQPEDVEVQAEVAEPAVSEEPAMAEPEEADEATSVLSALVAELAMLKGRVDALEAARPQAVAPESAPEPAMLGDVAKGLGLSDTQVAGVRAAAKTDSAAALALMLGMVNAPKNRPASPLTTAQAVDVAKPKAVNPKDKSAMWAACLSETKGDAQAALALYDQRTQ